MTVSRMRVRDNEISRNSCGQRGRAPKKRLYKAHHQNQCSQYLFWCEYGLREGCIERYCKVLPGLGAKSSGATNSAFKYTICSIDYRMYNYKAYVIASVCTYPLPPPFLDIRRKRRVRLIMLL